MGQPLSASNEAIAKERFTYREVTRRVYNLIFLKDQLNELVSDFIDKDLYKELNRSIFHLNDL